MEKNSYEIHDAVLTPSSVQPIPKGAARKMEPIEFNLTEFDVNAANNEPTVWEDICYRADEFRLWLATRCCACLSSVPSLVLVIIAAVLIMLLIATIPLAFALTYISPQASTADEDLMGFNGTQIHNKLSPYRSHAMWPNESELIEYRDWDEHVPIRTSSLLPKNISICSVYGFACTGKPHIIIPKNRRCDGWSDCEDGSDELDCHECQTALSCQASESQHSSRKICLVGAHLCNGEQDCPNGEDEKIYCRTECTEGEHKCSHSDICIPMDAVCDGEKQCPFGDDEDGCNAECKNGAKSCNGKFCLPKRMLCDGNVDCAYDRSDEKDCDCTSCSGKNSVLCNGEEKVCITKDQVCNERKDCPGGEDEEECPGVCPTLDNDKHNEDLVRCADGQLYKWHEACDGSKLHCHQSCTKCNPEIAFQCQSKVTQLMGNLTVIGIDLKNTSSKLDEKETITKVQIHQSLKECIHRSLVCDGKADCSDGSDEMNCCGPETNECQQHGFTGIYAKRCYSELQRCDGFADCVGGEDERDCKNCTNGAFLCHSEGRCIPSSRRCNGIEDCVDESDEKNCTCQECSRQPIQMYMCSGGDRCFPLHSVCIPYSACPNATKLDQLFCAVRDQDYF